MKSGSGKVLYSFLSNDYIIRWEECHKRNVDSRLSSRHMTYRSFKIRVKAAVDSIVHVFVDIEYSESKKKYKHRKILDRVQEYAKEVLSLGLF